MSFPKKDDSKTMKSNELSMLLFGTKESSSALPTTQEAQQANPHLMNAKNRRKDGSKSSNQQGDAMHEDLSHLEAAQASQLLKQTHGAGKKASSGGNVGRHYRQNIKRNYHQLLEEIDNSEQIYDSDVKRSNVLDANIDDEFHLKKVKHHDSKKKIHIANLDQSMEEKKKDEKQQTSDFSSDNSSVARRRRARRRRNENRQSSSSDSDDSNDSSVARRRRRRIARRRQESDDRESSSSDEEDNRRMRARAKMRERKQQMQKPSESVDPTRELESSKAKAKQNDSSSDESRNKERRRRPVRRNDSSDESSSESESGRKNRRETQKAKSIPQRRVPSSSSSSSSDSSSSDSSSDSSSSDEDVAMNIAKPVFVPKHIRQKQELQEIEKQKEEEKLEKMKLKEEKRVRQSRALVAEIVSNELAEKKALEGSIGDQNEFTETGGSMIPPPDDTDANDEEMKTLERENWEVRELLRVLRDVEEVINREQEKKEMERRRNMTDEERLQEDIATGKYRKPGERDANDGDVGMQRYHHRGAFYMDDDTLKDENDIRNKAAQYSKAATGDDKIDRKKLPKVMQVKKFGFAGGSKYQGLAREDTTDKGGLGYMPVKDKRGSSGR
ncbi:hypothetical protein CTEN210_01527 [Chaetoceros tenuissimus]|uniref:Micro-fibrillar-associated protein 1 C-terminal domain-containing protein n=1 Tax=Chaetoceros tenuissimus TaxID=426638 RepID=A0AAD3CFT2_9STRA|nr:hypothetical protein CTEN210_01527 [Chaetoceros tenuissimus]